MNTTAMRSRNAIIHALLCKLEESRLDEVTVSEIAAAAGVSRKTFYKNFHGKRDVMDGYVSELVDQYLMEAERLDSPDFRNGLIHYFSFWNARAAMIRVLRRNDLLGSVLDVQTRRFAALSPLQPLPWHDGRFGDEGAIDLLMIGGLWNLLCFRLRYEDGLDPVALSDEIITSLTTRTEFLFPGQRHDR